MVIDISPLYFLTHFHDLPSISDLLSHGIKKRAASKGVMFAGRPTYITGI
jgi:hypothetical protein